VATWGELVDGTDCPYDGPLPDHSADWVARSIAAHASAREDTDYGYLWWLPTFRANGRDCKCFAMFGTGGNKVYAFPAQQLVVVVTTTNFRVQGAGALTDRLLTEYILPSLSDLPR
jgi:hypothetical protein